MEYNFGANYAGEQTLEVVVVDIYGYSAAQSYQISFG